MRLLMIGDIGPVDDMIHIGDEAMFDEAVRQLRRRGADHLTAISSNPADTTARYDLSAVLPVGRGGSEDGLRSLVAEADGVLVTGGGNISSVWPTHIVERARLARLAAESDTPFVLSGQTIGPVLSAPDRETVARMLASARLVGARESATAALIAELGIPADRARQTVDDASFLADGRTSSRDAAALPPYALVTLARHVGDVDLELAQGAYARLLDEVAEQTGLAIVFHAHFASLDSAETRGDSAVHAPVAARMRSATQVVPTVDVPTSALLARGAELVVTSRYHPAVFAGPGGVPTIGIPVDDYTDVKLTGAIGAFGQRGVLPLTTLIDEGGAETVRDAWAGRHETRARGIRLADQARPTSDAWWDRVAETLGG